MTKRLHSTSSLAASPARSEEFPELRWGQSWTECHSLPLFSRGRLLFGALPFSVVLVAQCHRGEHKALVQADGDCKTELGTAFTEAPENRPRGARASRGTSASPLVQ